MKNLKKILSVACLTAIISSCTTIYPVTATNNSLGGKTGTSQTGILGHAGYGDLGTGLVLNGDYGVIEAAENGNIEHVGSVDLKVTNYYIFTKAEIIVSGE